MKILFLFLVLSASAMAQVQLPTNEAGLVQYQEIIRIGDGKAPARQVYEQIRAWAETYYKSGNEAEKQYDDRHGILFVRSIYEPGKQLVRYTLTVEAKIGRYRATITDLVVDQGGILQPVRARPPTADELSRVASDTIKTAEFIKQLTDDQTSLYRQINESCRATLARLKDFMQD